MNDVPISLRQRERQRQRERESVLILEIFLFSCIVSQSKELLFVLWECNTYIHTHTYANNTGACASAHCTYIWTMFADGLQATVQQNINQDTNIYIVIYLNYFITLLSVIICRFSLSVFFRLFTRYQSDKIVSLLLLKVAIEVNLPGWHMYKNGIRKKNGG